MRFVSVSDSGTATDTHVTAWFLRWFNVSSPGMSTGYDVCVTSFAGTSPGWAFPSERSCEGLIRDDEGSRSVDGNAREEMYVLARRYASLRCISFIEPKVMEDSPIHLNTSSFPEHTDRPLPFPVP